MPQLLPLPNHLKWQRIQTVGNSLLYFRIRFYLVTMSLDVLRTRKKKKEEKIGTTSLALYSASVSYIFWGG